MPARPLRHHQRRPQPGRQPTDPLPRRPLAGAGRLDLLRRAPPDRGPGPGRLRDRRLAVPVPRHDRLLDPAPAGVPRRQARARARDPRLGAARAPARGASCPNCEHPIERTFLRCPNCRARIKDPCESCGKPIDPRWSVCPYCETPQSPRRPAGAPAGAEAALEGRRLRPRPPPKPRTGRASSRLVEGRRAAPRPRSNRSQPAPTPPDGEPQRKASGSSSPRASRQASSSSHAAHAARPSAASSSAPALVGWRADGRDQAHPDPDQARRLRARAHRRDPRPLRAQGPADHRSCGC